MVPPLLACNLYGRSKPPPYIMGRTSLEYVGEGLEPPGSRILRFFNIFGKMIPSYKSVILSERSESKDLGSINNAKILRLRFTPLRMTRNGTFCVSTLGFSEFDHAFCAGGSRPSRQKSCHIANTPFLPGMGQFLSVDKRTQSVILSGMKWSRRIFAFTHC